MLKWHYIRGLEKHGDKWEGFTTMATYRASIPGGWLVVCGFPSDDVSFAPTFVPDPDHVWDGASTDFDRKIDDQ